MTKKFFLWIALFLLSAMTLQAQETLLAYRIGSATPEAVAIADIRHITFPDNIILITTTGDSPDYYQIGDLNKLTFGSATTGINDPKASIPDINVLLSEDGELTVSSEAEVLSLSLISVSGAVLQKTSADHLSVSSLPAGVYLLKVDTEQGIAVKKFIKN
jgi:hypothetical protein